MNKGDTIRFLDTVGGGTIIQVDTEKKMVWVETEDGFDVGPIPMAQCVLATAREDYMRHPRITAVAKKTAPTPTPIKQKQNITPLKRSQRQRDELIIDLHLNALPTNGTGMTEADKHNYQLHYFRMQMQQNIRSRGKRMVVIHGKGNGVLKNEIRQILKRDYANLVEFHDADFARFEEGATLIIIK